MELNGVANVDMMVQMAKQDGTIEPALAEAILTQLNLLERYMLAYMDHKNSIKAGAYGALVVGQDAPMWHEVRENPTEFPTNRERNTLRKAR